ncbi:MAG: hypothetical protein A2X28_06240 [Elusimicrobia bacterium GWA2_56_46]|nr:MAG: hypothetical protein A2X28_06240 [Elusimicrobia bacterium GWA2_56_46]OGR54629.1 MAG: hypothetical protein A2X39_02290 [Elusimicrobia bacterium GWC2_56_31]HBB66052.1 hypothetical protein [Elusimicrobiota bacterium]HBW23887.1 hypothetical protein [Elusimicrobiota bacterium]
MRKIIYNLPIWIFMLATTGCAMLQQNPPSTEEKRKISENFSAQSRIAIAECFHARAIVGDSVWAGWSKSIIPVNIVTWNYEYLINYPNPPSKYTFLEHDNLLQTDVYFKKRTFKQLLIGTARPVNGKLTAFFSPIEQFKEKLPFVDTNFYRTLLMHEMFHIYQLLSPA